MKMTKEAYVKANAGLAHELDRSQSEDLVLRERFTIVLSGKEIVMKKMFTMLTILMLVASSAIAGPLDARLKVESRNLRNLKQRFTQQQALVKQLEDEFNRVAGKVQLLNDMIEEAKELAKAEVEEEKDLAELETEETNMSLPEEAVEDEKASSDGE